MIKVKYFILLSLSVLFFNGCVTPFVQYEPKAKELKLRITDENLHLVKFDNPFYKQFSGGKCFAENFVLTEKNNPDYGYLFTRHLLLNSNCEYGRSMENEFRDAAKKIWNATDIKRIDDKKTIDNYSFSKFSANVNGKTEYIHLIHIHSFRNATFIVDPKGKLSQELIEKLEK